MKTSSFITIGIIAVLITIGGIFIFANQAPESESLTAGVALDTQSETKSPTQSQINVTVHPASIRAGESVTVTVSTLKDIPSFWLMDVYLEGPGGLNTARGSIANIDGEGGRFGDIIIPSDAKEGKWVVKTIEIINPTGNIDSYNYGEEISATFTVTALE